MASGHDLGDELGKRVAVHMRIEIEIASSSVWSDDATMAQIKKQGIEGAMNRLTNIARENGFRIVGKPTFTAFLAADN